MISVVIPTITGREHWLERALTAFCETTEDAETLIVHDAPTCNAGWNLGVAEAQGDYLLLAADDLEPHPGWIGEAIWWAERNVLPCPRVLNTDGTLQSCGDDAQETPTGTRSAVCRIPFLKREWLSWATPVPEQMHYMGDYWITAQGWRNRVKTRVVREMVFTHHLAPEGRKDTLQADIAEYDRLLS